MHVLVIVTFLLLAATGLPLHFHHTGWAQMLINLLGGVTTARFLHRLAAIGTFGYMAWHLAEVFYRAVVRKEKGLFWGWKSMVPQWKDVKDVWQNFLYFLYRRPKPEIDRWYCHWLEVTLVPLEAHLRQIAAQGFLHGAQGLFEAVLIPQLYNARRFAFDLAPMPHMRRIDAACLELPAFRTAHPDRQPDATTEQAR